MNIEAKIIPTREPDIECPECWPLFRCKIWIKENVVGFLSEEARCYKYWEQMDFEGEILNAEGYMNYILNKENHSHREHVLAYLAERALLDD